MVFKLQNAISGFWLNNSVISHNQGTSVGGAIVLEMTLGVAFFCNDIFQNNSLSDAFNFGGVISAMLSSQSYLFFFNNTWVSNAAYLAGVIISYSGIINDRLSNYLNNTATDNSCNFYLFQANVNISSAVFTDNKALNIAFLSIFTYSALSLIDVKISNLTTLAGGLNLANSIDAFISNLTFIDYCSTYGPAISLTSIYSNKLELNNITFLSSENTDLQCHNPDKILGSWESSVNITGFLVENITGNVLFDIRFNSLIRFELIDIRNNSCVSTDKGCLFLIDSNSEASILNIRISQSKTFNSLIFAQKSICNIKGLLLDQTVMDKSSVDQYLLILTSSVFSLMNFEVLSIDAKFLSVVASNLTIQFGVFNNSDRLAYSYDIGQCFIFLYQTINAMLSNLTIQDLGAYELGVTAFYYFI